MTIFKHTVHVIGLSFATILLLLVWAQPAYAYLDPGTGSFLTQWRVASILALSLSIGTQWRRAIRLFSRRGPLSKGQAFYGILNAVYMPGGRAIVLYLSVSPVNVFRLILNSEFNARLDLLEDRSYGVEPFRRPFPVFHPVAGFIE